MNVEELVRQLEKTPDWPFNLMGDLKIKEAFLAVDRADFIPADMKEFAYEDRPLPIGEGQTISQPAVVAFMLGLLRPKAGDRILDVGAGSGWQTGLLAKIVGDEGEVDAVEVVPELSQQARKDLSKYGFTNIKFFCQNARSGLAQRAPFDGIIAGATGESVPQAWKDQLKVGSNIVMPVSRGAFDSVVAYTKTGKDKFKRQEYPGFRFVPLVDGS